MILKNEIITQHSDMKMRTYAWAASFGAILTAICIICFAVLMRRSASAAGVVDVIVVVKNTVSGFIKTGLVLWTFANYIQRNGISRRKNMSMRALTTLVLAACVSGVSAGTMGGPATTALNTLVAGATPTSFNSLRKDRVKYGQQSATLRRLVLHRVVTIFVRTLSRPRRGANASLMAIVPCPALNLFIA